MADIIIEQGEQITSTDIFLKTLLSYVTNENPSTIVLVGETGEASLAVLSFFSEHFLPLKQLKHTKFIDQNSRIFTASSLYASTIGLHIRLGILYLPDIDKIDLERALEWFWVYYYPRMLPDSLLVLWGNDVAQPLFEEIRKVLENGNK